MRSLYRSTNKSIHDALRILARDIQSEDGAANVAIAEAADRISELGGENDRLRRENDNLKREIDEVKRVRYCAEDALTRSQAEAAAAWADKERLDWLLTDEGKEWLVEEMRLGFQTDRADIDSVRKEGQP